MVTDRQVRRLWVMIKKGKSLVISAAKSGMDEETGRKYVRLGKLPSQIAKPHTWRTRKDSFDEVWAEAKEYLGTNPGLEAKALFEYLQKKYPGKFEEGQIRTFQRRVKVWRAIEGPGKEVYFPQEHIPGRVCESDFTHMSSLGITIGREPFPHLLYHFVLPYSNWETGTICFSESYESLSEGLQNALWELGGVPEGHRTDQLSSAVHKECNRAQFTLWYEGLLRYYGMKGIPTQSGKPHEKGDVEQRHYRLKRAVEQSLILRGSRDFESREAYRSFLKELFNQMNSHRKNRMVEELKVLKPLPDRRLDDCKRLKSRVGPSSTIYVLHNTYSVPSRLIDEEVEIRVYAEELEVRYGQKLIERIPRLRGSLKHRIQYRHIIDWLVRKPGAFAQYRYREDLFPSTLFRIVYDQLKRQNQKNADKQYLKLLYLAARESETVVTKILQELLDDKQPITVEAVYEKLIQGFRCSSITDVKVSPINLSVYDSFLTEKEIVQCQRE